MHATAWRKDHDGRGTARVTAVAATAACGGFLFGFDTSTMNSAINGIAPSLALSSVQVGFVTAISLIGAAIGAWFAGGLAARFGREKVMVAAGALIAAGSVAAAFAGHVWLLGAVRVLTGLGIGAASAVVPAYISPAGQRLRLRPIPDNSLQNPAPAARVRIGLGPRRFACSEDSSPSRQRRHNRKGTPRARGVRSIMCLQLL
jgi:Sugar (and other) transporter